MSFDWIFKTSQLPYVSHLSFLKEHKPEVPQTDMTLNLNALSATQKPALLIEKPDLHLSASLHSLNTLIFAVKAPSLPGIHTCSLVYWGPSLIPVIND